MEGTMGLNIANNIESLNAQRNLNSTSDRLRTAYSRLSSGLRITKASDDAAGLAIADSLRADSRISAVAVRNANDAVSMISITDGAMAEVTNILTRMAELAEQSANGVYSSSQRSALNQEFQALGSEIQRISQTTKFNGIALLSNTGSVVFQIGFDGSSTSRISYSGVQATLSALGLSRGTSTSMVYSITGSGTTAAQQVLARSALDAVNAAIASLARNRGTVGAAESRLQSTINNLQVARENFTAAESRIRDVDVAAEAAELTRLNVLQQAATAVLGQANQQPALALQLLQ